MCSSDLKSFFKSPFDNSNLSIQLKQDKNTNSIKSKFILNKNKNTNKNNNLLKQKLTGLKKYLKLSSPSNKTNIRSKQKSFSVLSQLNNSSINPKIKFSEKEKIITKKVMKINSCTLAGYKSNGMQKLNQDKFFIKKDFLNEKEQFFIGVCDGHGMHGHFISEYISKFIPKNLISNIKGIITNDKLIILYENIFQMKFLYHGKAYSQGIENNNSLIQLTANFSQFSNGEYDNYSTRNAYDGFKKLIQSNINFVFKLFENKNINYSKQETISFSKDIGNGIKINYNFNLTNDNLSSVNMEQINNTIAEGIKKAGSPQQYLDSLMNYMSQNTDFFKNKEESKHLVDSTYSKYLTKKKKYYFFKYLSKVVKNRNLELCTCQYSTFENDLEPLYIFNPKINKKYNFSSSTGHSKLNSKVRKKYQY